MDLSRKFEQLSQGMIKLQPEVRDDGRGFFMFDDGATEVETSEFLYGVTRILKPQRVLTTGIYTGISDMYIAQGLKDNGYGKSTALEFEPQHLNRARELWKRTRVEDWIDSRLISSLDFQPEGMYQLMFLDTEPDIRFKELVKFYDHLEPGGFVLLHDLHEHFGQETIPGQVENWPWGKLPDEIVTWMKNDELRAWHFPNPRGLTGLYKTTDRTYRV